MPPERGMRQRSITICFYFRLLLLTTEISPPPLPQSQAILETKLCLAFMARMCQPIVIQLNEEATKAVLEQALPKLMSLLRQQRKSNPALSVKEAAEQLNLSDDTVRRMVDRGALIKVPGLTEIRIRQSVVDALGTAPEQPNR